MTDTKNGKKCNCCLFMGIIVLAIGIISGTTGNGFGLMQILSIVVGAILIFFGLKTSKFCKCKK